MQELNAGRVCGEAVPECEAYSAFGDEYIVRSRRFDAGQQEVVAFSVAVQRRFHEPRLRPRGMRGKREKLRNEMDEDMGTKAAKSLQTSMERSRRMIRSAARRSAPTAY